MSSTLTLKREATGAIELRRNTFEIVLDDNPAGTIDQHQTVELQVDPGPHTLQVKTGRYSSPARTFQRRGRHQPQLPLQRSDPLAPIRRVALSPHDRPQTQTAASGRTTSPYRKAGPCSAARVQHHTVLGLAPDRLKPACLASNTARRDPAHASPPPVALVAQRRAEHPVRDTAERNASTYCLYPPCRERTPNVKNQNL